MPELKPPYYSLGIDLGIASCGFALVDLANQEIVEIGSHLFETPVNPKNNVSLASERRKQRSARRNIKRTKDRLKHCMRLFKQFNLVPQDANAPWLQPRKGERLPLELRAYGLDNVLTGREFAQVLYTLCSRRGYIPHGEEGTDTEGKQVLSALKSTSERLKEGGFRTIGEMLAHDGICRNNTRGTRACGPYDCSAHSADIKHEVSELFKAQRVLGNELASVEFEEAYNACQYWEQPADERDARVYEQVGYCVYDPTKKRAASADISSEMCRAYERFCHTMIVREDGTEEPLPKELVTQSVQTLFSTDKRSKVTYKTLRKKLDLSANDHFKAIDKEEDEKREVFEPKAWRKLRQCLPQELLVRMLADRALGDAIGEALTYASTESSLKTHLAPLDLTEEERNAIMSMPFSSKLFSGYGSRSRDALDKLVSAFESDKIRTLSAAEYAIGLQQQRMDKNDAKLHDILPPYSTYDPTCKNPVVLRAVSRARHVINAIIRLYGVPHEIHIELARELKQSAKEKKLVSSRNKDNERAKKYALELITETLKCSPEEVTPAMLLKYELYTEQGSKDIYSGKAIDVYRLLKEPTYCEVDHILPYSRTADNTRANKVLVLQSNNRNKGNQTPYEWMTSGKAGAPDWDDFAKTVHETIKDHRKIDKLLRKKLAPSDEEEFISRNLNDTRYMSRAVKDFVENTLRFPEVDGKKQHVFAVSGVVTGSLRKVWGLNTGRNDSKDRKDDRHHAIDAAIIAACPVATTKKANDASKRGKDEFLLRRFEYLQGTEPWPEFRNDVLQAVSHVIPTRKADHGVTGEAYKATKYKALGQSESGKNYNLIAGGEEYTASNIKTLEDGTTLVVGGMAFVRLWCDPTARPKGKVKGEWYVEPVYCTDIPHIKNGTYKPRVFTTGTPRPLWKELPESAKVKEPVVIFRGDVLMVDNHIARFQGLDISVCAFDFKSILNPKYSAHGFPTRSKWGKDTVIRVLDEDCLGRCYKNLAINEEDSTFMIVDSRV